MSTCGIDCSGMPGWSGYLIGNGMLGERSIWLIVFPISGCRGRQAAVDVAVAVAYLHSLPVVHSDLKSR